MAALLVGLSRFALNRIGISKTTIDSIPPFAGTTRRHKSMIDPMDLATGIEKRERLAHKAGIADPFGMKCGAFQRGPGTKEAPNLIPSAFDARLVGCVCHPDQLFVQWMWLIKDMPKRCECGYWFKLVEVPAF